MAPTSPCTCDYTLSQMQTAAFQSMIVLPSAFVTPEPVALSISPNDPRPEWQIYQDYFRAPVHIKAQKFHDDLQTLLDTTVVPEQIKGCGWMKKYDGESQCKADYAFAVNSDKLLNILLRVDFQKIPMPLYQVVAWLLDEAKERSLEMYLWSCHLTEMFGGQFKLSIVVECNDRMVEFEALTVSVDRVALITKPHGSVVFLYPPHADDNLCDLTSVFGTDISWLHITNNDVLAGWLARRRLTGV